METISSEHKHLQLCHVFSLHNPYSHTNKFSKESMKYSVHFFLLYNMKWLQ